MALLPPFSSFFIFLWRKRAWSVKRFITICLFSLALPSGLALHSFWGAPASMDTTLRSIGSRKGMAPDMNYQDLLSVKATDAELFRAPE